MIKQRQMKADRDNGRRKVIDRQRIEGQISFYVFGFQRGALCTVRMSR